MSAQYPSQGNAPGDPSHAPQPALNATAPVSSLLPQIPTQPAAVLALLTAQLQQQQQQAAAAAQSQLFAARAVAPAFMASHSGVQDMSLEQLEQHVSLIQQLGQQVPQNVMMLLQDARKRAEKREAKRLANRKSASTSRARKKALVKEMTEMNARLRRQALILSLLPDLVLAVTEKGKVTFCGPQVERVLQHSQDDLTNSKSVFQFLVPESQRKLQRLIHQHFHPNQKLPAAAAVAEQFPMSVVNLDSVNSDENDTSDTSAASNGKQMSSLTDSKAANSDDSEEQQDDSDEQQQQPRKKRRRYQDDVTGATVTANNADARLSSLAHTSTTSSEDNDISSGGYRAQEDTSSSDEAAESEPDGRRRIPFSLTCTVCLVRRDRSTVWCEVTSSLHTAVVSPEGSNATEASSAGEAPSEIITPEPEILLCLRPFREGEKSILVSDSPDESNEHAVVESLISMSSSVSQK